MGNAFHGRGRFRTKLQGFQSRKAIYYCLQCRRDTSGSKKCVCGNKSQYFPSTGEFNRYAHLLLQQDIGQISNLQLQRRYPVKINGILVLTYVADFNYFDEVKRVDVIEDYKGNRNHTDAASKLRRKAAEAEYGVSITIVEG